MMFVFLSLLGAAVAAIGAAMAALNGDRFATFALGAACGMDLSFLLISHG